MKNLLLLAAACVACGAAVAGDRYSNGYGYTYPVPKPSYGYTTPSYGTGSNPSSHYVAPSLRNDGTYVQGHYQSNPNNTRLDNWSTKGNVNPYTGQPGTKNPYKY